MGEYGEYGTVLAVRGDVCSSLIDVRLVDGSNYLLSDDVYGRCLLKVVSETSTSHAYAQRVFRYSGEGDLLAIEDSQSGTTWIEHDAAHRLSRIVHADGRTDTYAYDAGDNLLRAPGLSEELLPRVDGSRSNAPEMPVSMASGNRLSPPVPEGPSFATITRQPCAHPGTGDVPIRSAAACSQATIEPTRKG